MDYELQDAIDAVAAAVSGSEVYSTLRLCTTTLPNSERWILDVGSEEAEAILRERAPDRRPPVGLLLDLHGGGNRICCHKDSFGCGEAAYMGLPYLSALLGAAEEAGHAWVDFDTGAHHPHGIPQWIWSPGPAPLPGSEAADT